MRPQSPEAKRYIQERFHPESASSEVPPLTDEELKYLKIGEQLTSEWIGIPRARALFARFERDYPELLKNSENPSSDIQRFEDSNVIQFPKASNG